MFRIPHTSVYFKINHNENKIMTYYCTYTFIVITKNILTYLHVEIRSVYIFQIGLKYIAVSIIT
jgi:hypothetical protein